jgi:hypothetical protein
VQDVEPTATHRWGYQVSACGVHFVQSEEWMDMAPRNYLREYACSSCLAKFPVPAEDVTVDGKPWPWWHKGGRQSPIFGELLA